MPTLPERMSSIENQMTENNKTTWRIHEAIYGNGKPGLVTEIRLLRQSMDQHVESHKEGKTDWKWLITSAIAVAAIAKAFFCALILLAVAGCTITDDVMVEQSFFTGATVITIPAGRSYELNVK